MSQPDPAQEAKPVAPKGQVVTQKSLKINPDHKVEIFTDDYMDLVNPLFQRYPEAIVRRMAVFHQQPDQLHADVASMIDHDMQQKYSQGTVAFMLRQYDLLEKLWQEIAEEQEAARLAAEAEKMPANRGQRRKQKNEAGKVLPLPANA